jgi:hypothetical protein
MQIVGIDYKEKQVTGELLLREAPSISVGREITTEH